MYEKKEEEVVHKKKGIKTFLRIRTRRKNAWMVRTERRIGLDRRET